MKVICSDPLTIRLSMRLYRLLLAAYPRGFRDRFAPDMLQVFHDCCLQSHRLAGLPGLLDLWSLTVLDYLKSVVSEHQEKEVSVNSERLTRLSGMALLAGAMMLVLAYILGTPRSTVGYAGSYDGAIALTLRFGTKVAPPLALILLTLGTIGLLLQSQKQIGTPGRSALVVAVLAGGVSASALAVAPIQECWARVIWWGLAAYFAGMALFGVDARRRNALPRRNSLLLTAGGWLLVVTIADDTCRILTGRGWISDTEVVVILVIVIVLNLGSIALLETLLQTTGVDERPTTPRQPDSKQALS